MERDWLEALKTRFVKAFAGVPLPLRDEIVAVVDDKPVSWNAAYLEITNNGPHAEQILQQLEEVGVLS